MTNTRKNWKRFLTHYALWMTLLGVFCGSIPASANAGGPEWIKKERVRAGYGGPGRTPGEAEAIFAKLRENGFNAYFAKADFDAAANQKWEELAARADLAQKHNIRLFLCVNFLGGEVEKQILAQCKMRYTPVGGPRPKTACPLDNEFWQKAVTDRALQAAKISKAHPGLVGFIVDPEMYGADASSYGPPCLCDECFKRYLVSPYLGVCMGIPPNIPPAERVPFLKKREGGEKEYALLQGAQAGSIARSIRRQVDAEAPEFLLGWLGFYPGYHWFSDAVLEQWATDEAPVVLAPEVTYYCGYSKGAVDGCVEKLKTAGINAAFLPGIGWDPRYPCIEPEHLPAHLYLCATHGDGYWVWHLPSPEAKGAEAERNEKYWAAYKLGNEEIAKWAASGGKYQTGLKLIIAPPNPKREAVERFVKAAKTFAPIAEGATTEAPEKPTRLRGAHQMIVLVRPGEGLSVQATAHRLGAYAGPCGYFVFDAEGQELKRGQFDVGQPTTIEIPDAKPGAYLIALTSRGPIYSLVPKNRLAVVEAAPLHPCTYSRPLYFFVPRGVAHFSIHVQAEPLSETALAKVFAPDGKQVAEGTSVNKGPFTLDVAVPPGMDGKAWRVELTKGTIGIYEDMLLSFGKEIPPYVAEQAAALIVPRQEQ